MPKVIRPPGKRQGSLGRREGRVVPTHPELTRLLRVHLAEFGTGRLTRFDPGAPVGDRGQFAAAHSAEQATVRGCRGSSG